MSIDIGKIKNISGNPKTIDFNNLYKFKDFTIVLWHEIQSAGEKYIDEWVSCAIIDDSGDIVRENRLCKGADPQLITFEGRVFLLSHIRLSDTLHRVTLHEFERVSREQMLLREPFVAQWEIPDLHAGIHPFLTKGGIAFFYSRRKGIKEAWNYCIAFWTPGYDKLEFSEGTEKLSPKENLLALDWIPLQRNGKTIIFGRTGGKFFFHNLNLDNLTLGNRIIVNEGLSPDDRRVDYGNTVSRWVATLGESDSVLICAEIGFDGLLGVFEFSLSSGQGKGWLPYAFNSLIPDIVPFGSNYLITFTGENGCIPDFWEEPDLQLARIKSNEMAVRNRIELKKPKGKYPFCLYPSIWIGMIGPDIKPIGKSIRVYFSPIDSWGSKIAVGGKRGYVVWRSGDLDYMRCQIMAKGFQIFPNIP